jgi:glycosyltransferase involved in cell wall biosynthesis
MTLVEPGVVHVVADLRTEGDGLSYSVSALAAAQARNGASVRLRTVGDCVPLNQDAEAVARFAHARSGGPLGRTLRSSPDLAASLTADARSSAVIHTHGLWLMPNIYPHWAQRQSARPGALVHSPHGMLGAPALRISAWKKRPFWWLAQRWALQAADCLHATAPSEYAEIRAAGLKNPVAVIPNGIDLPDPATMPVRAAAGDGIVLSLGRIHPKKGLDRLVHAWALIEPELRTWRLRIVGPAEVGHDKELAALARALGLKRVSIEGPLYGAEKLGAYRDAELFVLSTLNENFALTVAEALAAEVPVISTRGAPWGDLEAERCGWWIDHGVAPLAAALRHAMTIGCAERRAMGARGRAWMARDFGWDRIAADMLQVYRWLKSGGEPPPTMRLD